MKLKKMILTIITIAGLVACNDKKGHENIDTLPPVVENKTPSERWNTWRKQWTNSFPTASWSYFHWYGDGSIGEYLTYKDAGLTMVQAPLDQYDNAVYAGLRVIVGAWDTIYRDIDKLDDYIAYPSMTNRAVKGYGIYDEPHPEHFDSLAVAVQRVYETDKRGAIPFINLLPNWLVPINRFNMEYKDFVNLFVEKVNPAVMLSTHYPIMCDGSDTPGYYDNAEIFRQKALEHNIGLMGFVSLASFVNDVNLAMCYRAASESDIYWQVYSMVAYGAQGIWYFNYRIRRTEKYGDGLVINDTGEPNPNFYPYVRRVNNQLHNLAPILMRLQSVGVYHLHTNVLDLPLGTTQYADQSVPSIESLEGDNFIVSHFRNQDDLEDNASYVMLVNKRHGKDMASAELSASVYFSVADAYGSVYQYNPETAEQQALSSEDGSYKITLNGGYGILLKIVKN